MGSLKNTSLKNCVRISVGNLLGWVLPGEGVHLWDSDGSCTLLSQRRGLSPFSSEDLLGPLPPHFVPRAGYHQIRSLMVTVLCPQCVHPHWGDRTSLTCTCVCTASPWKYMCLPFVPLENTDSWEFSESQACCTSLWLWVVKHAFQLVVCPSSFLHFYCFCFGHRKSLTGLWSWGHTAERSLPRDYTHTYRKGFFYYIWSLINLGFPFQIMKNQFHIKDKQKYVSKHKIAPDVTFHL